MSPGQRGGPCTVGGCPVRSSRGSCTEKGSTPIRSQRQGGGLCATGVMRNTSYLGAGHFKGFLIERYCKPVQWELIDI